MSGFLPLQRQLMEHWTYKDIYAKTLWLHMLLVARYSKEPKTESYNGHLVTLNYGEFVYGRKKWSDELQIPEQRMRSLIQKFVDEKMIELRYSYAKGSVYTILNYAKFNHQSNHQQSLEPQGFEGDSNHHSNHQSTTNQPQNNKVIREQLNNIVPFGEIISHLNAKTGMNYKSSSAKNKSHINARWNEGYRLEDFINVIDTKCYEWKGTEYEKYLRPETLFGTKFENYVNQKAKIKPKQKRYVDPETLGNLPPKR